MLINGSSWLSSNKNMLRIMERESLLGGFVDANEHFSILEVANDYFVVKAG